MSHQIDILIDIPDQDLVRVVEANLEGRTPLNPGDVDLAGIAARLGPLLSGDADISVGAGSLWVFDPGTGLQLDLEATGGQINLPLAPSDEVQTLAAAIVAVVSNSTNLFGFDAQREVRTV